MTPPKPDNESAAKKVGPNAESSANPILVTASDDASKLSPEEQMALYEKDLKENDWGHQPC